MFKHFKCSGASQKRALCLAASALLALSLLPLAAFAVNPVPQQTYYVSLPEDNLLQLFDDNDAAGGTFPDPVSPIRSVTSISIGSTGTYVYWDQWEDGSYDADIANPGANTYASPGNLDGTQIWGDGILSNGCPPSINNVPNPCLVPADDQLAAGDVIILDNEVTITGSSGSYARNPLQIFFDGRDKFGASYPVAVTRGAFPISPGSVMAGANEVLDTKRWGTSYEAPLGEDTLDTNTNAFEDVRWFIMAGTGGATVDVDANGDGDLADANDLNDLVLAEGARHVVNGILMGGTLTVVAGNPVQVNSMTADVDDTFEFRWDALIPRDEWSNDYYTPVGTAPKTDSSGCTEVEVYNPNATTITINYDFPGGSSPDGAFTVAAGNTATGQTTPATPLVLYNNGARYWSVGGQEFLPISVTDCTRDTSGTDGRLYDWGNPLFPADDLTSQVLVGWAPGCSNESLLGICQDADITNQFSRSVVWVTPVADTIIYVDTNGSGIDCNATPVTGAEQTINPANALVSYRIDDDPSAANTVRDNFSAVSYSNNNGSQNWANSWDETGDNDLPGSGTILITGDTLRITGGLPAGNFRDEFTTAVYSRNDGTLNWAGNWTEENDDGSATSGTIYINTTDDELRFRGNSAAGDAIRRTANLSSYDAATLSFELDGVDVDNTGDEIKVQVSGNGGSTWTDLETFSAANDPNGGTVSYDITAFIASNTIIRFIMVGGLETGTGDGERWDIDNVDITVAAASAGDSIERQANLSGQVFADLTFELESSGNLDPDDTLAVDISSDGGATWVTLATYRDDPTTNVKAIIISPYSASNTRVRFRQVNDLAANEYWNIDQVQIKYATNGDYDMTAARIATCDGTKIAAAWGQNPALSGSNDEEALDMGTGIAPYGGSIALEKSVSDDLVDPGTIVTYTYEVANIGETALEDVSVTDNKCYPAVYVSGDVGNDGKLEPFNPSAPEIWVFTCQAPIFVNTTNVAFAEGTLELTTTTVRSAPDEELVEVTSIVGDYVWLDANGDGVQDAGESGIPNVQVTLTGTDRGGNAVSLTTVTDANGQYLFSGVPPSDASGYTVTVVAATLPNGGTGLSQTYDEDGIATANNSKTGVLGTQDAHLTADFGYRYGNGVLGAIGDRVWIDANGDGIQDPNEVGYEGATVRLTGAGPDNTWGTGDDILLTTTTGPGGYYLFSGLAAGWYNVEVTIPPPVGSYTQTGDPDSVPDNKTTTAYQLAAGENQLDIDFGYQPKEGAGWIIGDEVFLDSNGDGNRDTGEPGIAGVTVALIKDTNGDGDWDAGEPIIATTVTDGAGLYSFPGVPNGNYLVWINDTSNLLSDLTQSSAPGVENGQPCGTCNDFSGAIAISGADNLAQDFGYKPTNQDSGEGVIGDTIFLDANGNNSPDAGEGIQGVIVELYIDPNNDGIYDRLYRTTITDANGLYSFGGLPLDPPGLGIQYQVRVKTSTLPNGGAGLTNTYDPDAAGAPPHNGDNESVVPVLTSGNPINLNQDFGYRGTNAAQISGTVWEDVNKNGTLDAGETSLGFSGVTVVLRDSQGNVVGQKTTDSAGDFSFTGLPPGTYTVDVTDQAGVLTGYVWSDGPNDGANNNSQVDPYTVTVAAGQSNNTADFGYYREVPTLAILSDFRVYADAGGQTVVEWETAVEIGTMGFYVERQDPASEAFEPIHDDLLGALIGSPVGGRYRLVDPTAVVGQTYVYQVVEVDHRGVETSYGPYRVTVAAAPGQGKAQSLLVAAAKEARVSARFEAEPHSTQATKALSRQAQASRQTDRQAEVALLAALRPVAGAHLEVAGPGLYYASANDLATALQESSAKVKNRIRSGQLQLRSLGNPVAYRPAANNNGLYFFGQASDSLYSRYNVYKLSNGAGDKMASVFAGPLARGAAAPTSFRASVAMEEDRFTWLTDAETDPQADLWHWACISAPVFLPSTSPCGQGNSFTVEVKTPAARTTGTAQVRVYLKGASDWAPGNDHQAILWIGGAQKASVSWNGAARQVLQASIDQSLLSSGKLALQVTGQAPTSGVSLFVVDRVEVDYDRDYRVTAEDANQLRFTVAPGVKRVDVGGFSSNSINVLNVTDPWRPQWLTNLKVAVSGGSYQVSFAPATTGGTYLAVAASAVQKPAGLETDFASSLRATSNGASYLVIAPLELQAAAEELAAYRSGLAIDVQDIYDEWNYGMPHPDAIKAFFAYAAQQWEEKPGQGVLMGRGTIDPKDHLGYGNHVLPVLMTATPYGPSPCDLCFGDVLGDDGVPEVDIGRISAETLDQALAYVAKVKTYESSPGAWASNAVMLADNPDAGGAFPTDSSGVSQLLADAGFNSTAIDHPGGDAGTTRESLITAINAGAGYWNYIGHGSLTRLAGEGILRNTDDADGVDDVARLDNDGQFPVMAALTCTVGNSAFPEAEGLAQSLALKPDGGIVAGLFPYWLSLNSQAVFINRAFVTALYRDGVPTLGDAVRAALQAHASNANYGSSVFNRKIYRIEGDPGLQVHLP